MTEDLSALRARLAARLPEHAAAALAVYEDYIAGPPPADSKGFAAWNAAAKAALAHLDLLVKLARWAQGSGPSESDDGVERLLRQARAAIDAIDDGEEEE